MLSVLADKRKLKPLVILKRNNLSKLKFLSGIILQCTKKRWMAEKLMVKWLREIWDKRPGALLKKRGMLVLNSSKGHLTKKVRTANLNTDIFFVL
jgi:hypothetical protein